MATKRTAALAMRPYRTAYANPLRPHHASHRRTLYRARLARLANAIRCGRARPAVPVPAPHGGWQYVANRPGSPGWHRKPYRGAYPGNGNPP